MSWDLAISMDLSTQQSDDARLLMIDDAWIAKYHPFVYRNAWLMTGRSCEAEDLTQDVLIIAIDQSAAFRGDAAVETWLCGILIRLVSKRRRWFVRMKRRLQTYTQRRPDGSSIDPEVVYHQKIWKDSIWAAVSELPTEQAIAVTLRFTNQFSYEEIADTMQCPIGTVKSRVHQGLKRLRVNEEMRQAWLDQPQSSACRPATNDLKQQTS